ncbi:hypothetical protein D3C71_1729600 [compost metagenome]
MPAGSELAPNRNAKAADRLRRVKIIKAPVTVKVATVPPPIRFDVEPVAARTNEGASEA